MIIPKKVRIGSVDYDVVRTDENLVCNGQESYGWIDYNYHLIKINKNIQDEQGQEKTFLHELIHGIVRERNLDVKNSDEEVIVDEISIGLHQVIRDNPEVFKVITASGIITDREGNILNKQGEGGLIVGKYRKKPVIIDAFKWTGDIEQKEDPIWIIEAIKNRKVWFEVNENNETVSMFIDTLEGVHEAKQGDYIIRGIKGEIYPCKPDIFEMTYGEVI